MSASSNSSELKSALKDKWRSNIQWVDISLNFFSRLTDKKSLQKEVDLIEPTVSIATYEKVMEIDSDETEQETYTAIKDVGRTYQHDDSISLAREYPYSKAEPFPEKKPQSDPKFKRSLKNHEQDLESIREAKKTQLYKYQALEISSTSLQSQRTYNEKLESKNNELSKIIDDDKKDTKYKLYSIYCLSQEIEYLNCAIDHEKGNNVSCKKKIATLQSDIKKIDSTLTRISQSKESKCTDAILQELYKDTIEIMQLADERKLAAKFMDSIENEQITQQSEKESSHQAEVDALIKENKKLNKESQQSRSSKNNQHPDSLLKKTCRREDTGHEAQSHNLEVKVISFGM